MTVRPKVNVTWAAVSGLSALAWSLGLAGCDCETAACEATKHAQSASKIEQGVVGVVAYQTDSCDNSCCACSWSDAELTFWTTPEPVRDRDAVIERIAQGAPTERLKVDRSYEHALEPGEYLLCESVACAALSITRGDLITVNLQQVFGPTQLLVFVAGEPRADLVFEVGEGLLDAGVERD